METPKDHLRKLGACEDAREWAADKSYQEIWNTCHRGDWMLWWAKRLGVDLKILTKAKAKCALTVRHLMKDHRSIDACEVALKFAEGQATRDELNAYAAAAAAAAAAYADAAADAADAADAAAAAAYADAAAAADAYDADAAAARIKNQKQTADICRDILTEAVFERLGVSQVVSDN